MYNPITFKGTTRKVSKHPMAEADERGQEERLWVLENEIRNDVGAMSSRLLFFDRKY